jgi:hypothetical protein
VPSPDILPNKKLGRMVSVLARSASAEVVGYAEPAGHPRMRKQPARRSSDWGCLLNALETLGKLAGSVRGTYRRVGVSGSDGASPYQAFSTAPRVSMPRYAATPTRRYVPLTPPAQTELRPTKRHAHQYADTPTRRYVPLTPPARTEPRPTGRAPLHVAAEFYRPQFSRTARAFGAQRSKIEYEEEDEYNYDQVYKEAIPPTSQSLSRSFR